MSAALKCYFQALSDDLDHTCENLTIVIDNAHLPAHSFNVESPIEAFSRSLSSLNTVTFPPAFFERELSMAVHGGILELGLFTNDSA